LGSRAEGLQHILHVADNRHDEAAYIFGILTIEYKNSLVEVEEALVHVNKFIMSSLADRMIQKWICSMHWKVVLMLLRYEELGWRRRFFADVTSHNAILRGAKR
jgi:predicted HAD superfamily hydrolase